MDHDHRNIIDLGHKIFDTPICTYSACIKTIGGVCAKFDRVLLIAVWRLLAIPAVF